MPSACEVIAERLREAPARIEGRGTRPGSVTVDADPLSTLGLDAVVAFDPEDFTAVLQAGVRVSDAQAAFAEAGQMLAVDPPGEGTIGGLFATAASGPLRHRYGAPRDLIIGVELALADGTLARGGGRVIKNVAGYDLPKLAAGSYGTLGVLTEVAVRLHPKPPAHATAVLRSDSPDELQRIAIALNRQPLEAESLDVRWDGTEGAVLARFAGDAAADRAARLTHLGDASVVEDDEPVWEEQRSRQTGRRVTHLPTQLADVLRSAPSAVGRAGIGTTWIEGPDADPFEDLDRRPEHALMRAVKDRFDPEHHCNPGLMFR